MKQIDIKYQKFTLKGDYRTFFCTDTKCDYNLNVLGIGYVPCDTDGNLPQNWDDNRVWLRLPQTRLKDITIVGGGLNGAYNPAAALDGAFKLNVLTPDSMDESTAEALNQLRKAVGNVAEFVAERLQYSLKELSECLALEQIDAVALAIYNAEARNQGLIVGDQTGIGKGRVAAAFIRYGVVHGYKPVFFTEKPGLFSDIYRDLTDIHCPYYRPFIINSSGSDILNDDGDIVYKHDKGMYDYALNRQYMPEDCDFVCCTYSQLSSGSESSNKKQTLISALCKDNIVILDEAHNAGGEVQLANKERKIIGGRTAFFFQTEVLRYCKSVMYLSATYAKRPANMPVYALNTCIADLGGGNFSKNNLPADEYDTAKRLLDISGYFYSIPAQEIVSSSMARYGQFIRRERVTKGMNVDYYTLDDSENAVKAGLPNLKNQHWAIYKNITEIYARIRRFQEVYFQPYLTRIAKSLAEEGLKNQKPPTVASASLFSSLFHLSNNILLSMKALPVAERAIQHVKDGKAVVIALADTNESVLKNRKTAGKDKDNEPDETEEVGSEIEVSEGMKISGDYTITFDNIFKNLFFYYIKKGRKVLSKVHIEVEELGIDAVEEYHKILDLFRSTTSGLCFSPIDIIRERIEREGFKVAECTGRDLCLNFKNGDYLNSTIEHVKKFSSQQGKHVSLCYKKFNNNEVDVLIINQSGSTGKSAHATNKNTTLRPDQVKQRVMLIAQAELDVNTEVQKRGRINRTGQFEHIPPQYEYIFSAIPCEKRFMMMLKAKLKSLDANTTSNQKQSDESVLKTDDFFNRYGDDIVREILSNDWNLNHVLNDPLAIEADPVNQKRKKQQPDEMARTVFGRMQVLSPEQQDYYYNTVLERYNNKVEELKANDEYDLEIKVADFQAQKISENLLNQGKTDGSTSELSGSTFLTKYSIRQQTKLLKLKDLNEIITRNYKTGLGATDEVLKRLKISFEETQKDTIERKANNIKKQTEAQKEKIEQLTATVKDYVENGMSEDSIARAEERVLEAKKKLKTITSGQDEDSVYFDKRLKEDKEHYESLKKLIDTLRVGKFFEKDNNIYCVTSIYTKNTNGEFVNIFNAPSNIICTLESTDPHNTSLLFNFAEMGANSMREIVKKETDGKAYDNYIKNDKRREEAFIITGNIVPKLSEKGVVITRFTHEDGSFENGIVVKPVPVNGVMQLPEFCRTATIPLTSKTIKPVLRSLSSGSRVDFNSVKYVGLMYISGIRTGDNMVYYLTADSGYKEFLYMDEVRNCFVQKDGDLRFKGEYNIELENVNRLLEIMVDPEMLFSTKVAFSALTAYADALDFNRYKPQDWAKLSYDKKNIPSDKAYAGRLLTSELALLSVTGEQKSAKKSKTDDDTDTAAEEISVVDYSEKSWAVTGGGKREWDILKKNGGKYNSHLSVGRGWVLPKSKFSKSQILKLVA